VATGRGLAEVRRSGPSGGYGKIFFPYKYGGAAGCEGLQEDQQAGADHGRKEREQNDEELAKDKNQALAHDIDAAAALAGGLEPGWKNEGGGVGDDQLQGAQDRCGGGEAKSGGEAESRGEPGNRRCARLKGEGGGD
jgi:hypothetical protein